MENVGQLQRQYVDFVTSLYHEGFLDEQFVQLQKLQDECNPDFVVEVVSLYFEDSEKLMNNLATALQQHVVDFKQVDAHVHQFKGSSSSIGAQRVKNLCVVFRDYCEEKNLDGTVNIPSSVEQSVKVQVSITSYTITVKNHRLEAQPLCLDKRRHSTLCLSVPRSSAPFGALYKLRNNHMLERQILEAGGTVPMIA
ncbi:histidine-containing phosphotransfer protein 1-like [Dorcoceras hygrometricum]|uniref:Histidine-containing phosphotransfer protein n=1 Tax=Dorcoceras hygrometricum TaxID=472368 RepID=A0A2Z7BG20_9LAMI|nr:histidine-containing phosphotransfer protein 1-like [Dorcoceras hygrometricum]